MLAHAGEDRGSLCVAGVIPFFIDMKDKYYKELKDKKTAELKRLYEMKRKLFTMDSQNSMDFYKPYPFQREFHKGSGDCGQRLMMCANRVGKTEAMRFEVAFHATGRYPDWWVGKRYDKPVLVWACGTTNETTRDIVQKALFGDPANPEAFGTGSVPKKYMDLAKVVRKPQVPNAYQSVPVKHISGRWSNIVMKSYDAKKRAFMGQSVDIIALDEEPTVDIMGQCLARLVDKPDSMLFMTFTPEYGMTEVVSQFMTDLKPGQSLVQATWDDAPHLTEKKKEQILAAMPVWERDMRSKGIPVFGDGLIFPVVDEDIMIPAFKIPDHFRRLGAIDFGGWAHPTAGAWVAYDDDSDIIYITDTYKSQEKKVSQHADSLRSRGKDILFAYPHDGEKADRGGTKLAQGYRDKGVNMMHTHFTNPPAEGEAEGKGGNAVSPGLVEMLNRMQSGRLKVFSHLNDWFKEKAMYHTKDGNIVRKGEDIMSASRYAVMSVVRFGLAKHTFRRKPKMMNSNINPLDFLLGNN